VTIIVLDPTDALATALEEAGEVTVVGGSSDAGKTMWEALVALQTACAASARRVVLVVPTIGMAGARDAVDYTTAIEGIRAMAKSAARQWGSTGIGVNTVAAPAHLFAREVDASHLSAPAVDDDGCLLRTVVETVRFLLREDLSHLTGDTVIVDGGSVMLP
jgi:3-oxoacyl-[acyl-carrier protein] reductase